MKTYNEKRNFERTPEPRDEQAPASDKDPIFVIQKHEASRLHYDFRLQISNTLKSWAVPKGPSRDPAVKRMAVPTEDHPLAYAEFEGSIPEGEYGGGTVMIWDKGSIESLRKDDQGNIMSLEDSYSAGNIEVGLHGKKLKGAFHLIKMTSGNMKGNWLLFKGEDQEARSPDQITAEETTSAVSGRSMEEIASLKE